MVIIPRHECLRQVQPTKCWTLSHIYVAFLAKHHANWRLQALHSLDRADPDDLHYSGPMALSEENAIKLRALLLNGIEGIHAGPDKAGGNYGRGIPV